jgi:cobalt-zinc-cadmium efflux system outer membrane protein
LFSASISAGLTTFVAASLPACLLAPLLAPLLAALLLTPAYGQTVEAAPAQMHTVTLKEVETIVLDANHDIRLARIAVDGARAGIQQADTRPNPTLSWNAASLSPSSVGGGPVFSKRVDQIVRVDETFERGGKRQLRIALAETQLDGKRLDLEEQRRETLQTVRDAYIDLLLAEQRIEVFDETEEAYRKSLDAATKRVRSGDLAEADLARFRVEVFRATTDRDAALGDRARAQVALATLLAIDEDPSHLKTDGVWPVPVRTNREGIDVETRPDVVSAKRAVEAAATSIELARSQRVRDVTIGAQFERYPGIGGTGNTIGAGVSVPLFIGNDYRGDIAHAVSDREAAEESAAKVRAAAIADIAGARSDLAIAARKIETYRGGLLEAAQSAASSADFAFSRGALGIMELMDSRRTLLATRLDALAAQADYARASVAFEAATTRALAGDPR